MRLYKISQNVNNDYGTYSDAVVCASNEDEAKRIHPSGQHYELGEDNHWYFIFSDGSKKDEGLLPEFFDWCKFQDVQVEFIGEAKEGLKHGVVCASFHAG